MFRTPPTPTLFLIHKSGDTAVCSPMCSNLFYWELCHWGVSPRHGQKGWTQGGSVLHLTTTSRLWCHFLSTCNQMSPDPKFVLMLLFPCQVKVRRSECCSLINSEVWLISQFAVSTWRLLCYWHVTSNIIHHDDWLKSFILMYHHVSGPSFGGWRLLLTECVSQLFSCQMKQVNKHGGSQYYLSVFFVCFSDLLLLHIL